MLRTDNRSHVVVLIHEYIESNKATINYIHPNSD